jgi:acyl-CoA thioesterase FadM
LLHNEDNCEVRVTTPYEGLLFQGWDESKIIDSPLSLHECTVIEEWTDYNDHLSESFFLYIFGDNTDAFFRYFGVDENYRLKGFSLYTVETHIRHLGQARLGDEISCTIAVVGVAEKKLHLAHQMFRNNELIATGEQLILHVDMNAEKTVAFSDELLSRLNQIRDSHMNLKYEWLNKAIRI